MKLIKSGVLHCLIFLTIHLTVYGEKLEEAPLTSPSNDHDPLFISLGADCTTSGMIQYFGKRNAAFPLDWILTLDEDAVIQLLGNNFQDFTNKEFLARHPINPTKLVHTHYHIEFIHDLSSECWKNPILYDEEIEKMQMKYQRRIARFQQLANYQGPVIFIRILLPQYLPEEIFWFDYPLNKNEKESSVKWYEALRNLFPNLDFKLIVVKKTETQNKIEFSDKIILCYLSNIGLHSNWETLLNLK